MPAETPRAPLDPLRWAFGSALQSSWDWVARHAAIGPNSARGRKFGAFGADSAICFPTIALYNEHYMRIGHGTIVGPYCSLSVGMAPGQAMITDPVLAIGNRCVIGRGSSIVAHLSVEIGDDVFTGPNVYVTDQNHRYTDIHTPIGRQDPTEAAVRIGPGSWLGTGAVVLPGVTIGRNAVIGAGCVVNRDVPDYGVAVGNPARLVRKYEEGKGWVKED
jgi:acetyltransferase-like isoleucine patch superfamily enzyme